MVIIHTERPWRHFPQHIPPSVTVHEIWYDEFYAAGLTLAEALENLAAVMRRKEEEA